MATAAEIALWTKQLADAEAQYHEITIGRHVNRIRLADREVQNSAVSVGELRAYINELRTMLGLDPRAFVNRTPARRIMFQ